MSDKKIYSYFPGCTLKNKAKELDAFARASAQALGFELQEIQDWQCCGGVYPMSSKEVAAKLPSVRALADARDKAVEEMLHRAKKMGANAVVGVDVDYEVLGEKNGMLMVSVSGTAVVVE